MEFSEFDRSNPENRAQMSKLAETPKNQPLYNDQLERLINFDKK